jgi:TRAP-type C4-dicarboxylate transport system substrate-binding protein
MGNALIPWVSGTYPLFDFGSIAAFLGPTPDFAWEWSQALLDPRMKDVFEQYSRPEGFLFITGTVSLPNDGIWGNRPVRTLEEFDGLKTRTSGVTQTLALELLGASPLTLPFGEIFEALRRGTVDAITTSLNFGTEQGLMDICPYVSMWPITPGFGGMLAINAEKFDSLSPDLQEAIIKAGDQLIMESFTPIEQMSYIYPTWINSAGKTEIVTPEEAELNRGMAQTGGVADEWLDIVGPLGQDVLRIAADYATGPNRDIILSKVQ